MCFIRYPYFPNRDHMCLIRDPQNRPQNVSKSTKIVILGSQNDIYGIWGPRLWNRCPFTCVLVVPWARTPCNSRFRVFLKSVLIVLFCVFHCKWAILPQKHKKTGKSTFSCFFCQCWFQMNLCHFMCTIWYHSVSQTSKCHYRLSSHLLMYITILIILMSKSEALFSKLHQNVKNVNFCDFNQFAKSAALQSSKHFEPKYDIFGT